MMMRNLFSAALLLITALSLAPQALVCGTVQKHECSCCGEGPDCTCCTIAPAYPDQAAASTETSRLSQPQGRIWETVAHTAPAGQAAAIGLALETVHGPPPLLNTSQLRL